MTTTQVVAIASIATVVVSTFAIVVALRSVRDQLRVTIFIAYTDRYAKVMDGVPFEARQPGSKYRLSLRTEEERIRVLSAFRDYLNLCSEEMWLHERGRIDGSTWNVWEAGMQQTARFPSFREAWDILAPEYDYYNRFQEFVVHRLLPFAVASNGIRETDTPGVAGAQ